MFAALRQEEDQDESPQFYQTSWLCTARYLAHAAHHHWNISLLAGGPMTGPVTSSSIRNVTVVLSAEATNWVLGSSGAQTARDEKADHLQTNRPLMKLARSTLLISRVFLQGHSSPNKHQLGALHTRQEHGKRRANGAALKIKARDTI
ncbi:hypothetical protein Bbelb_206580 [Branchiostoma belcheri]|nr:hypothetical protein Bbelb_206580 [Branchiostoma belcheri]